MQWDSSCSWQAGSPGSMPREGKFGVNTRFQHWGLCIPRELGNHVDVGPVSICDVKESVTMTSTLAVTILSASIERSTRRICSEKD